MKGGMRAITPGAWDKDLGAKPPPDGWVRVRAGDFSDLRHPSRVRMRGQLARWGSDAPQPLKGSLDMPRWCYWLLSADPMSEDCRAWATTLAEADPEFRAELDTCARMGDVRAFTSYVVEKWVRS